jgi:hypothetical protein
MTPEQEAMARRIIDRQVVLSGATLDALRSAGLTDDRRVQIDFFFNAPSEASAKALVAHLEDNDCLDVSAERAGGFLSRRYRVVAKTHPTVVTSEILAQWLPWIVVQGATLGCEFDGWGAEA